MVAETNKQRHTARKKQSQIDLVQFMALIRLATGLEPKIGQVLRKSDTTGIVSAFSKIKRELQLHQIFEENATFDPQKINTSSSKTVKKRRYSFIPLNRERYRSIFCYHIHVQKYSILSRT